MSIWENLAESLAQNPLLRWLSEEEPHSHCQTKLLRHTQLPCLQKVPGVTTSAAHHPQITVIMLDNLSSQYDSFLFWKLPIPELDLSELQCLGLEEAKKAPKDEPQDDIFLSQYSAFNFWRAPIASIDAFDFDLI